MAKTEKELAFIRDLISDEWTKRFTDLVDKHLSFSQTDENLLYLNAGTGNHCFALREKVGSDTAIFASCETEDMVSIARDKAIAVKSDVDFSTLRFEDDAFDSVLADASFIAPAKISKFIDEAVRVARPGARVSIFFPTAGSYGEVFSLLWEVLYNEDLGEHGAAAEAMIAELPSQTSAERIASAAGLENVESFVENEVFEFENGKDFVEAPLVADFLLPHWIESLSDSDKGRVTDKLSQLIDAEDGTMTFRFSVKASLVSGKKAKA